MRYRAAGLSLAPDGKILIQNRIIVKLSRLEVARRFLAPAPADVLNPGGGKQDHDDQAGLARRCRWLTT